MVAEYLEENYDRVCRLLSSTESRSSADPPSLVALPSYPRLPSRPLLIIAFLSSPLVSHQFFTSYALLVQSDNYVTKRQSLKLLGEILLDRTNFKVMTRYIANEENLKMMMNLLKDRSKNIQFEAFHVFKVSCVVIARPHAEEEEMRREGEAKGADL